MTAEIDQDAVMECLDAYCRVMTYVVEGDSGQEELWCPGCTKRGQLVYPPG